MSRYFLLAITLLSFSLQESYAGQGPEGSRYKGGEVLIKIKKAEHNLSRAFMRLEGLQSFQNQFFSKMGLRKTHALKLEGVGEGKWRPFTPSWGKFTYDSSQSVSEVIENLRKNPSIESVEPNFRVQLFNKESDPAVQAPSTKGIQKEDPSLSEAYGLKVTQTDEAWKITTGSKNVIVAVIDSGVDYNHEDLVGNIWRNPTPDENGQDSNGDGYVGDLVGYDFINKDSTPYDDNMHGTHCAGVIGAVGNNGVGISGVNQEVSIMALKFTDESGGGSLDDAVSAIDYAIAHGAQVISASWGGAFPTPPVALQEAMDRAEKAGILFVAAAGNGDWLGNPVDIDKDPVWPASFKNSNVVAVAASDSSDQEAWFSNFGAESVDLHAPGVDVYSTIPKDIVLDKGKVNTGYTYLSGTSMATPHVAGAAALVLSHFPGIRASELKKKLLESVDPIPAFQGKTVSGGRLNVLKALQ